MNRIPSRVRALVLGVIAAGAIAAAVPSSPAPAQEAISFKKLNCVGCQTPSDGPVGAASIAPGIRW